MKYLSIALLLFLVSCDDPKKERIYAEIYESLVEAQELEDRYEEVNEKDTLLVCAPEYLDDIKYKELLIINGEDPNIGYFERYNPYTLERETNSAEIIEYPSSFKITFNKGVTNEGETTTEVMSLNRFSLKLNNNFFLEVKNICKRVIKTEYLNARNSIIEYAESLKSSRKI
tara:strand:- start:375 stop:890 length:516 start_codon:yes stop_codon:yes gene_type:complete